MAEKKTHTVDDYKALLGATQRQNMYKIDIVFPAAITNPDAERAFSILCDTATMPGERSVEPIVIAYEGDYIKLAGDKGAPTDITFAFINSELNLYLRKQFRLWSQLIQPYRLGTKTAPSIYKTDSLFISLLDYNKEVIEKVQLIGAFALGVNDIGLDKTSGAQTKTEIAVAMDDYKNIV